MKKIPITVVLLVLVLCVSTALAFELGFNFGFGGRTGVKWIDLLPVLSGWTPTSKAFGNVSTGVVKRQSFIVANTGNDYAEDVTVGVTSTGFSLYSTQTFGNISAGRSLTAKVRFSPAVQQSYSGHLTYSAPNISAVSAALTGAGVSASLTKYASVETFDDYWSIGNSAVKMMAGWVVASGTHSLKNFDIYFDTPAGNISAKTYTVAVYARSGNNFTVASPKANGVATAVSGSTISSGWKTFTFPIAPSVTTGDVIVFYDTALTPEATNYPKLKMETGGGTGGYLSQSFYNASGVQQVAYPADVFTYRAWE